MAIYKGREVQLIGKVGGADTSPLYTIQEKDGTRADVQLNAIQFTEKEIKDSKDGASWHLDGASVIADKDLQVLRDKQDRQKIEGNTDVAKTEVKPTVTPAKK